MATCPFACLQLTELAWVYLLDVTALGEPTSLLASLGTAVVFGSAVAAASLDARATGRADVSPLK